MSLHTRGNVETLFGAIVNYDISLNSLGGYDITLTIRTQGHAFYNQDFNTDNSARIGPFLGIEGATDANVAYIAGLVYDRPSENCLNPWKKISGIKENPTHCK